MSSGQPLEVAKTLVVAFIKCSMMKWSSVMEGAWSSWYKWAHSYSVACIRLKHKQIQGFMLKGHETLHVGLPWPFLVCSQSAYKSGPKWHSECCCTPESLSTQKKPTVGPHLQALALLSTCSVLPGRLWIFLCFSIPAPKWVAELPVQLHASSLSLLRTVLVPFGHHREVFPFHNLFFTKDRFG